MTIAKNKPLKLHSVDHGDLKRLSSTEENYLAYLVGSHLIESNSDVGNITLSSSGNTEIGLFLDTYFNEPDGTHPESAISSSSVTTKLYQVAGIADESDSDFRRPVAYDNGVREMADSDLNVLVDRINGRIAQSDYLGQFYLGTSAPSADYNVFLSGVFTDTVNDSTVNTYNIYRRENQSAPTGILDSASNPTSIMSVKRTLGNSGDFEGLQRMTDRQVKVTLGQRAKTRRATVNGIGSYQLRSSDQGAPSTGLWRAVGTATNTKKTTALEDYTRIRTSSYSRQRPSSFSGTYTRNSTLNFIGDYSRGFTRTSTRTSSLSYSRNFLGNFTGNFVRNFSGNFLGNYSREFIATRTSNYSRVRESSYTRTLNYNRTRISSYIGDFIGNYTREIQFQQTFNRLRPSSYTRAFVGDFTRTSSYSRTLTFTGNFVSNFVGDFTRVTSTRTSTRFVSEGPLFSLSAPEYYWAEEPEEDGVIVTVVWNGTEVFGSFVAGSPTSVLGLDGLTYYKGANQGLPFFSVSRSGTLFYTGNFSTNYTTDFTRESLVNFSRTSTYSRTLNYTKDRVSSYFRNITETFIGNFLGNVEYTREPDRTFSREFEGIYSRTGYYVRDFSSSRTSTFSRSRSSSYSRTSTRTRESAYATTFTKTRVSSYTRLFSGNFLGNYSRNYLRTRTSTYLGEYSGLYTRNITDTSVRDLIEYSSGLTIKPTTSVIETFTLYVRYA